MTWWPCLLREMAAQRPPRPEPIMATLRDFEVGVIADGISRVLSEGFSCRKTEMMCCKCHTQLVTKRI